ncbi:MAG: class I SAM-dependent methyltransferase, partial [Candidatus Eremiobacteraeota bacterium]|nr:class I SAM-dependent methyltransferase [Candidatus Eremiobacteraeota bacterium]
QALARHFEAVVGVDISRAMIDLAQRYNSAAGRCTYLVNDTNDLSQFADGAFTFVHSIIVLQHIRQPHSLNYVREFARVTAPGGAIVFQVPEKIPGDIAGSAQRSLRRLINTSPFLVRAYRRIAFRRVAQEKLDAMPPHVLDMEPIDRRVVEEVLRGSGARLLGITETGDMGFGLRSLLYVALKN